LAVALCTTTRAKDVRPEITDDVVHYTDEDGKGRTIDVGKKCTDLWSAPDGSILAFIAIDRESKPPKSPLLAYEQGPTIDKSSIYIARRAGHFIPTLIPVKPISMYGIEWVVFRRPSVSPDGTTLFFEIPDSMVSSTIMNMSLSSGALQTVGVASDYCVIWNGRYSGKLILQRRHIPTDPSQGVQYGCYLRDVAGRVGEIAGKCDDLEEFAKAWAGKYGGICTPPMHSEKWPHVQ
jgi:hypothetical protein